jgi:phytoene dehydrogenase-like protein
MASAKEVDCLVIGGGVSGISAAVYADKGGAKILLAEKATQLGGVIETRERDTLQWVLLVFCLFKSMPAYVLK